MLVFHAYINETHGSRSKIPSKKSRPYIYVKFLTLLGAPYVYDISRLTVKVGPLVFFLEMFAIMENILKRLVLSTSSNLNNQSTI
jgi:hypothetical protein